MAAEALYFSDPAGAVKKITALLHSEDWPTLARYYDLSDSPIAFEELESGRFFIVPAEQRMGPPGLSHIRQPFPPGFSYRDHQSLGENLWSVKLVIRIDQSDGMVLEGLDEFTLKEGPKGFQIIADSPLFLQPSTTR